MFELHIICAWLDYRMWAARQFIASHLSDKYNMNWYVPDRMASMKCPDEKKTHGSSDSGNS